MRSAARRQAPQRRARRGDVQRQQRAHGGRGEAAAEGDLMERCAALVESGALGVVGEEREEGARGRGEGGGGREGAGERGEERGGLDAAA